MWNFVAFVCFAIAALILFRATQSLWQNASEGRKKVIFGVGFTVGMLALGIIGGTVDSDPAVRAVRQAKEVQDARDYVSKKEDLSTGSQQSPSSFASNYMNSINQKVIDDAEQEYQIATQGGSDTDRCVAAGMVAAAYQQAHNQSGYNRWKMREDDECDRR
jgi:hypothetical protein